MKIYIDYEPECTIDLWDFIENNDRFIITGNRHFQTTGTAAWYDKAKEILNDLDNDYFVGACLRYYSELTRSQRLAILKVYNDCEYSDSNETIASVASILTGHDIRTATIRGCVQGDWNEIIYDATQATQDDVRTIESYYFGDYSEIYDGDIMAYVTNDEIRNADNLKAFCLESLGYPTDTECELYESNGYVTAKAWSKVA